MPRHVKFGTRFTGAVAVCAILAMPVLAQDNAAGGPTAETVVATVNGANITLGHMVSLYENLPEQYQSLPPEDLFKGILDQLVQQTALAQEAEGNLTRRDQLGLENEERAYKAGTVLDKTANAAVSDEALQAAYDAEYAGAEPSQEFSAAHILVETEDEAKEIKAQLDEGSDFTALAKEKSTGPSGPNGGDLGWFGKGMMVKPFEDAILTLKPGEVSAPIETEFGWHVIKLNETRNAEIPNLEDVRTELEGTLRQTAVQDRVTELTDSAEVERMTDGIDPTILTNPGLLED